MFGNRLGWGISAVIVIFVGLLSTLVQQAQLASAPTGWAQKTAGKIELPPGLDQALPEMNNNRDAGDFYRQAIEDYRANPAAFETLASATAPSTSDIVTRPGLKALLGAANCSEMDLFRSHPESIVNYDREIEPLAALDQVAHTAVQIALRSDAATARVCFTAVFSLGVKLFKERVVYQELTTGEELMGVGCQGLKNLAHRTNDPAREQLLEQFDEQRLEGNARQIQPMWSVLANVDMNTISAYAGDWFLLAKDRSFDPLWRTEATLKLGQLKFAAARIGDQKAAEHALREMSNDPTDMPSVHAAAKTARDLTVEQYRMLQ